MLPQADGSVAISKHALLSISHKDVATFISDKKLAYGPKFGVGSALFEHHTTSLVYNDPPLHSRARKIITTVLNPRAIQLMQAGLEEKNASHFEELKFKSTNTQQADQIGDCASKILI